MLLPGHFSLVAVDPAAPSTIYAAAGAADLGSTPPITQPSFEVSDDGGQTWEPLADGLPSNVPILDLAFDAGDPSLLYAATLGAGVMALHRVP